LVEKAALHYTYETLPPHPEWCERASDPREACASDADGGEFAAATHTSVGQIQSPTIPDVYLERTDLPGFGLGPIEIGISLEGEEGFTLQVSEARVLGHALIALCERAEAFGNRVTTPRSLTSREA
jgi:hypothetical protein